MYPDVVSHFIKYHDWKFDFFYYEKDRDIKLAYLLCNRKQVGIMTIKSYPLSLDDDINSFCSSCKMFFPDKKLMQCLL